MPKTRVFDAAEYLDSPEMIAEYLTEAFETDDEVFIAKAIGTIARAQGMGAVAEAAGSPGKISIAHSAAIRGLNSRPSARYLAHSACNWWRSRG